MPVFRMNEGGERVVQFALHRRAIFEIGGGLAHLAPACGQPFAEFAVGEHCPSRPEYDEQAPPVFFPIGAQSRRRVRRRTISFRNQDGAQILVSH